MKRNTSLKGQIAETAVLNELVKQGFNVSVPFGDYRYDLIAEKEGHLSRIQVKYVSWTTKRNTLQIIFHSITRQGRKEYSASDVDYFIAYHEPTGQFYVIPFKDIRGRITIQLRLEATANNQKTNVTPATQYENRWDLLE